jgi:hypothetical protein
MATTMAACNKDLELAYENSGTVHIPRTGCDRLREIGVLDLVLQKLGSQLSQLPLNNSLDVGGRRPLGVLQCSGSRVDGRHRVDQFASGVTGVIHLALELLELARYEPSQVGLVLNVCRHLLQRNEMA